MSSTRPVETSIQAVSPWSIVEADVACSAAAGGSAAGLVAAVRNGIAIATIQEYLKSLPPLTSRKRRAVEAGTDGLWQEWCRHPGYGFEIVKSLSELD